MDVRVYANTRRPLCALGAVALACALVASALARQDAEPGQAPALAPSGVCVRARVRSFTPTVVLPGQTKCPKTDDIMSHYRWWVNVQWLAPEGSRAAEGDTVALVSHDSLENWVRTDRYMLRALKAGVRSQEERVKANEMDRLRDVRTAQRDLQEAEFGRRRLERGREPEELRIGELAVEKARVRLAADTNAEQRLQALGEQEDVSEESREQAAYERRVAGSDLEMADAALHALKRGPSELELLAARAKVESAAAKGESVKRSSEAAREGDAAETARRREEFQEFKTQVDKREDMLKTMTLKARMPGLVLWLTKPGTPGVSPSIILTIVDPDVVLFIGQATERQVPRLAPGQTCTVELPALAGRPLTGKVAFIGVTSEDLSSKGRYGDQEEPEETGCRVYDVAIALDVQEGMILSEGMTGKALVTVGEPVDGITVPQACVRREGGKVEVLVRQDEGWRPRAVTIAAEDDLYVAVASGLKIGEEVAIPTE